MEKKLSPQNNQLSSEKILGLLPHRYPFALVDKVIGNQTFVIDLNPKSFVEMIAPARTFGFKDQFQELSELGLIKGGSLENALVCDGDEWVNPPLRFDNEPIRHKILDLIGDLALVGLPKAQILVYKGSHSLNALLASSLKI